jgi:hypothetical protein
MEIPSSGKREWIASILISAVVRNSSLDDLHRSLVWERLDKSLVERMIAPMREARS